MEECLRKENSFKESAMEPPGLVKLLCGGLEENWPGGGMSAVCSDTGGAEHNRWRSKHLHFPLCVLGAFFLPISLRCFFLIFKDYFPLSGQLPQSLNFVCRNEHFPL